jgi:hypothetical protein
MTEAEMTDGGRTDEDPVANGFAYGQRACVTTNSVERRLA